MTGVRRGRESTGPTGDSPEQARARVGGSPGGAVGAAARAARASGPPVCVLDVVIRIFGDKGLIEQGRPAAGSDELRERLWIKFFGEGENPDDEKCKVLAAKLLLHALRYNDYENIRKDPTRSVLPILTTDHNLENFWEYAFGGIAILMEKVNAARAGTFAAERVELAKRSVRMRSILDEEAEVVGNAEDCVKVLSRMLTCLSPYKDTNKERGSLTKIAGNDEARRRLLEVLAAFDGPPALNVGGAGAGGAGADDGGADDGDDGGSDDGRG